MRYIVIGAGAVGSAIGIALVKAGRSVAFVARGRRLAVLRSGGLTVASPDGTNRYEVEVGETPGDVGLSPDDVLLLAVKAQDTATVIREWRRASVIGARGTVGQVLPLVCLQNGIENERVAQRYFDRVVAACVWVPAQVDEGGTLVLPGSPHVGAVDIGRFPVGVDDTCRLFAADLARGGIVSRAVAEIMKLKYYKLIANVKNVVTAVFAHSGKTEEIAAEAQQEALDVFAAAGVEMSDRHRELSRVLPLTTTRSVPGFGYVGNSTAQSLHAGTGSVETDYLNGEIVLQGHQYGVPTPVNSALQRLAVRAASDRIKPFSLTASDFECAMVGEGTTS